MDLLRRYSKQGDAQMRRSEAIRTAVPVKTPDATRTARRPRGRARQLTDTQVSALLEAYRAGDSTYQLAERFNITRETVAAHLGRAGVPTRGIERVELTEAERTEAQRLWDDGVSYHRISIALGVSERAVSRTLHRPFGRFATRT